MYNQTYITICGGDYESDLSQEFKKTSLLLILRCIYLHYNNLEEFLQGSRN